MPFFPLTSRFMTLARACAENNQNFEMTYIFRPFGFLDFFVCLLQLLTYYWACFQYKNSHENTIEAANSYNGVAKCSRGKYFAPSFALKFLSIFVHVSSIDPISPIWVSLEIPFPLGELEYK